MSQPPPANSQRVSNDRYSLVNLADVPSVACPCGSARRAFQAEAGGIASMHVVDISAESRTHYHKRMTEFYYVLEGQGQIELDEQLFDIGPGSAVMIRPGCRHRAIGKLKILNVPVPAFDPDDEWFD